MNQHNLVWPDERAQSSPFFLLLRIEKNPLASFHLGVFFSSAKKYLSASLGNPHLLTAKSSTLTLNSSRMVRSMTSCFLPR